jgi:hypothetical protein
MLGVEQPAQRTFLGGASADSGAGVFRALEFGVFLREGSLTRRRGFAVGAAGGMFGEGQLMMRDVEISRDQIYGNQRPMRFIIDAAALYVARE